jgi:hypothetical protein
MGARSAGFWHTLQMTGEPEQEAPSRLFRQPANPDPPADDRAITQRPPEVGGPQGPEPTRYGDWERAGRCVDF